MESVMFRYGIIALALLAAVPAIAQQRPRDDVMAGAYRCSAIGAARQWLDCYYGAAQPVRGQLGLPPAPKPQIELSVAPPASPASPRIAALRDAVMASTLRCYATEDDRAWLDCYYAAAAPMRGELGLSSPVPAAPAPLPAGAIATRPAVKMAGRLDRTSTRMASYTFDRDHVFTVTLVNGQSWRQVSGDTHTAHWTKPAQDYSVKVSRGAFSSFNFQVDGLPEVYKVDPVG